MLVMEMKINLKSRSDYYWDIVDIVEDKVIRGPGPTAVKSRLGYFLSGPMINSTGSTISASMFNVLVQHKREEVGLE